MQRLRDDGIVAGSGAARCCGRLRIMDQAFHDFDDKIVIDFSSPKKRMIKSITQHYKLAIVIKDF